MENFILDQKTIDLYDKIILIDNEYVKPISNINELKEFNIGSEIYFYSQKWKSFMANLIVTTDTFPENDLYCFTVFYRNEVSFYDRFSFTKWMNDIWINNRYYKRFIALYKTGVWEYFEKINLIPIAKLKE